MEGGMYMETPGAPVETSDLGLPPVPGAGLLIGKVGLNCTAVIIPWIF